MRWTARRPGDRMRPGVVWPGPTASTWLAAVAEMADRVRENNWDDNLDEVLVQYPPSPPTPTPTPEATPIFLPLILKG